MVKTIDLKDRAHKGNGAKAEVKPDFKDVPLSKVKNYAKPNGKSKAEAKAPKKVEPEKPKSKNGNGKVPKVEPEPKEVQLTPAQKFLQSLAKAEGEVRRWCIMGLGFSGEDIAVDACIEVLDDRDPRLREAACFALGLLRPKSANEKLKQIAKEDSDIFVRAMACYAIGEIAGHNALSTLVGLMEDKDLLISTAALDSGRVVLAVKQQEEAVELKTKVEV